MGEVFNGDPSFVGPYQECVSGLFNYPMYYSIRDAFQSRRSMSVLRQRWFEEEGKFRDIDALGIFVDNHDNARFLNGNSEQRLFKSALAFSLTARGVPFFYYGSEQAFNGGNDPYNREALWNSLNTTSDIYTFVQKIMRARKSEQSFNQFFYEKQVDDQIYAFSRGTLFVVLTNVLDG